MGRIIRAIGTQCKTPSIMGGYPTVGKLKVGIKNAKGYPQSVDYFVPSGKYAAKFTEAYGDKPSNITVVFVDDDPDRVFNQRYELRDHAGKLFGYGDGESFEIYNAKMQDYVSIDINDYGDQILQDAAAKARSPKGWEVVLTIRFLLPEIRGVVGLWQLSTKGERSSIPALINAYDSVKQRAGSVVNIPFDLQVSFATSQRPGSKSRFPVIQLVPNISVDSMDKLSAFIESGQNLQRSGLLTDATVQELGQRYLQAPEAQHQEKPQEPEVGSFEQYNDPFEGQGGFDYEQ